MPSGKVHAAVEVGLLLGCSAWGAGLVARGAVSLGPLLAFCGGFLVGMLFLSPDLDLARSGPMKRWGRLAFLWWPYARLFRHRGISHHVVWGSLTRLAYLAAVVGGIAVGVSALLGLRLEVGRWPTEMWAVVVGVYAPNVAHALLDGAAAVLCRRRRRARRA